MTEDDSDSVKRDPQTGKKRDAETGNFVSEHDAEEFVEVIEEMWPEEFPTTQKVADRVGISRRGAHDYLVDLEDSGRIGSRMSGPTKVWMPADAE